MPHPAHSLSNRQRRRGVTALIVSNFLSWAGFFLLVPLVAVHYVDDLGWAAGLIGVMLAVRQFSQQGLAPIFGVVCDRTGPKPLICAGQLVRAVGFGSLAFVESTGGVLLAMILAGLGGAMFEAPKSSAMAALTTPEERQRRYALLGVTSGLGVTLGTQAGAVLIKQDFGTVALVAASVYVFLSAWIAIVLPRMRVSTGSLKAMEGLTRVWHDRPFVTLVGITIGYYFAANQFTLTFTLAAADVAGSNSAVAWIYLVNTAISVGLGYFVPRWLERWFLPVDAVALGTIVISLGLGMVAYSGNVPLILLSAAVFSLGAVASRPGLETLIANLADPAARGTYFGISQLSLAIGGAAGYLLGGLAYDYGKAHDAEQAPWLVFFAIGVVTAFAFWVNRHALTAIREDLEPPSASTKSRNLNPEPAD
jgi:MFS transporter, DHA1 family, multidrug resistance protein